MKNSILFSLLFFQGFSVYANDFLMNVYKNNTKTALNNIASGVDVNQKNRYGINALAIACENGNYKVVEALVNAGADINNPVCGEPPLMIASRSGSLESVKLFLKKGVKPDVLSNKGYTSLIWAVEEGHADICKVLIAAGADKEYKLKSRLAPLHLAARNGHLATVTALIDSGCDVQVKVDTKKWPKRGPYKDTTPLRLAVFNNHFEVALKLIEAGADPAERQFGDSILHTLARVRRPNIGEEIDSMPTPRIKGRLSSLEFVRILVEEHKVNVDIPVTEKSTWSSRWREKRLGATPFHFALFTGDLEYARLLLKLGADPKKKSSNGTGAILMAAGLGSRVPAQEPGTASEAQRVIEWLLELKLDINSKNDLGQNIVHAAASKSYTGLIPFLVEKGATPDKWYQKDKNGFDPLMIARGETPIRKKPNAEMVVALEKQILKAGLKASEPQVQKEEKEYSP